MKRILAVCLAVVLMLGCMISASATEVGDLEARQAELESEQAANQAKLQEQNSAVTEQQTAVDELVGKVQSVNAEIATIHEKIATLDTSINEKQVEIDAANAEIETDMNALRQRIKTIYIAGDVSSLEIVLGAKDFSDFLDKIQLVEYVSDHDEELINGVKDQLITISDEKASLQSDKEQQLTEQENLTTKQTELNTLLEENQETLKSLQFSVTQTEMQISLNEEELSALSPQIQEHYRQQAAAAAQRQSASSSGSSGDDDDSSGSSGGDYTDYNDYSAPSHVESDGSWVWPTPGCYTLTSEFNESRSYESHGGVDVGAGMGTPIYAANSGTVSSTCNECTHNWAKDWGNWCSCGGGYGNYVMIYHDNGYETIYGHMSSVAVSQGSHVEAGQLIGYVGSTGWSTGAHLHFEVHDPSGYKVNPMNFY